MANEPDPRRPPRDPTDAELEKELDEFLDWAESEGVDVPPGGLPPLDDPPRVASGRRLGDFELLRRIDAGGMGVIYEARQHPSGRPVAVKVLREHLPSPRLAERFRREIDTILALEHPGIVPVVAAGVEDGAPYYVMPLLDGLTAADLVHRMRASGGAPERAVDVRALVRRSRRPADDAPSDDEGWWLGGYHDWVARCVADVAGALQYAHDRGVVHRDVKPANVMIRPSGRPLLLDFGLAHEDARDSLTSSGDFLGTLAYASPEQARGEGADARSDVFGLGATLYELLTLRRAAEARTGADLLRELGRGDPPPMGSWIPPDLRTICHCCLSKARAGRYPTAHAVAADLEAFLAGRPIRARPAGVLTKAGRWVRRYPRVATALAAAALAVLVLSGHAVWLAQRSVEEGRGRLSEARRTASHLRRELVELRGLLETSPHETRRFRRREWLREDVARCREELKRRLAAAAESFEDALGRIAAYGPARRGLAELASLELEQGLFEYEDVYRTAHFRAVEERLERFDRAGRYAALLRGTGDVVLRVEPPGTHVAVYRAGEDPAAAAPLFAGAGRIALSDVAEGSYFAVLDHPGRAPGALYPFLVRRSAADLADLDGASLPPRELDVRLPGREELGEGYVPICGGWTFVDDDPPRVEFVETFGVQREELTFGEWVGWMNWVLRGPALALAGQVASATSPLYKPRLGEDPGHWSVVRDAAGWQLGSGVDPRLPVRGLGPEDVEGYVATLNRWRRGTSEIVYCSLPSVSEWIRAARGADVRPYPWGGRFAWDRFAGFASVGALDREPDPFPVGTFPGDVSPFGVRDLAGSVAELTRDSYGLLWDESAVAGGSYRTFQRGDVQVTRLRRGPRWPLPDVGFRLVKRSLPAFLVPDSAAPSAVHDDFDAREGDLAPGPWRATCGAALGLVTRSPVPERCFLREGRLVLRGAEGNFSTQVAAWRPVAVAGDDFRASAVGRARFRREGDRGVALELHTAFLPDRRERVMLHLDGCGVVSLSSGGDVAARASGQVAFDPDRDYRMELTGAPGCLEGRVWPADEERPAEPCVWLPSTEPVPVYCFLGLSVPSYVGATFEVDSVTLGAAPP